MQIFKKLLYNILAIQEKLLRAQLSKTIGVKNNSKKKRHYFGGCTIDLSTLAENEKQKLEEEMTLILKKYNYEPYEILKYIEKQGTKVFYLDNASKFLTPFGENEGFIYAAKGSKALLKQMKCLFYQKVPLINTISCIIFITGMLSKII